jgi:branched-chain amino acid transport system ATP-binding protein
MKQEQGNGDKRATASCDYAGSADAGSGAGNAYEQRSATAAAVTAEQLASLAGPEPCLVVEGLSAGYGNMEVLHHFDLQIARAQSVCLIGPNGAGKSTVLNAIYGFATVFSGRMRASAGDAEHDLTRLTPSQKLSEARIAYVLQENSAFPDMSVEENLWIGGHLLGKASRAKRKADEIFTAYPQLALRRRHAAGVLSGGERRLLEISRALMMEPEILLIDEPSIGLEPRFIDVVFEVLGELQHRQRKTIVMVEQNARRALEFADIGYVLVAGETAMAAPAAQLLSDAEVGRLFLGG